MCFSCGSGLFERDDYLLIVFFCRVVGERDRAEGRFTGTSSSSSESLPAENLLTRLAVWPDCYVILASVWLV